MGTKGYLLARGCSDCCKFYCNADAAATDPTNVASAATLPPATGTTPGAEGPETQLSVSTLTITLLSALLLGLTAAAAACWCLWLQPLPAAPAVQQPLPLPGVGAHPGGGARDALAGAAAAMRTGASGVLVGARRALGFSSAAFVLVVLALVIGAVLVGNGQFELDKFSSGPLDINFSGLRVNLGERERAAETLPQEQAAKPAAEKTASADEPDQACPPSVVRRPV